MLYLFCLGLKSKLGRRYKEEELVLPQPRPAAKEFPERYAIIYKLLIASVVGFMACGMFCFPLAAVALQKILYGKGSIVFLSPYAGVVSVLPSLPLSIIIWAFARKLIGLRFAEFGQYQELRDYVGAKMILLNTWMYKKLDLGPFFPTEGLKPDLSYKEIRQIIWNNVLKMADFQKISALDWHWFFKAGLIVWLFVGPIYILAMDSYIIISQHGMAVNPVFGVTESDYSWQDIESAKIYSTTQDSHFEPRFEIKTTDGNQIELWGGLGIGSPSSEALTRTIDLLNSNSLKIDCRLPVFPSDSDLSEHTKSEAGKVFRHACFGNLFNPSKIFGPPIKMPKPDISGIKIEKPKLIFSEIKIELPKKEEPKP